MTKRGFHPDPWATGLLTLFAGLVLLLGLGILITALGGI